MMRLHRLSELTDLRANHTFRTPWWSMLLLPLVLLLVTGSIVWALLTHRLPPLFWASALLTGIMLLFTIRVNLIPSFRRANWTVKLSENRLYLMVRNFRNTHNADDGPVVVSWDYSDIVRAEGLVRSRSLMHRRGRERKWTERHLRLTLRGGTPSELRQLLDTERNRRPPWRGMSRQRRYFPSPVSCDERSVSVVWNDRTEVIKPGMGTMLDLLGRLSGCDVQRTDGTASQAAAGETDIDNQILELCQRGDRLAAIQLVRAHHGCSLTEAVTFVEELMQTPRD
ncbi:MAG: hypothetical protein KDA58_16425 [Planctomycetaceae bacterium]|nr:hypothetical protein [Planctomycetaceae bacterium]